MKQWHIKTASMFAHQRRFIVPTKAVVRYRNIVSYQNRSVKRGFFVFDSPYANIKLVSSKKITKFVPYNPFGKINMWD